MTKWPKRTHWKYSVFVIRTFHVSVIVSDFDIRISSFRSSTRWLQNNSIPPAMGHPRERMLPPTPPPLTVPQKGAIRWQMGNNSEKDIDQGTLRGTLVSRISISSKS